MISFQSHTVDIEEERTDDTVEIVCEREHSRVASDREKLDYSCVSLQNEEAVVWVM